jgi:uncharacterized membrane protein
MEGALRALFAVAHVTSALLYVTGYLSTGTLSQFARRARTVEERNALLALSGRFDFLYQIPFGTLVGISGLLLFMASGYSISQRWVWLSIVLYAVVVFIGAGIWRRLSMRVRAAQEAGDDTRVLALLGGARVEALRWIERALVVAIVVLMVLRPA